MQHVIILHSTCCYYHDTVRLSAALEPHPLFAETTFSHVMTGSGICTYYSHLPRPRDYLCESIRRDVAGVIGCTVRSMLMLEEFCPNIPVGAAPFSVKDPLELSLVTYKGLNLWRLVRASVASYLQWECLDRRLRSVTPREMALIQRFLADAARYVDAAEAILERVRPTHCIVFNGSYYLERVFVETCRRSGVATIAIESSTFRNLKYLSQTGAAGNRIDWAVLGYDYVTCRVLEREEQTALRTFIKNRFEGEGHFIAQPKRLGNIRERLSINSSTKVVLFLGQVPHDSVMTLDSTEQYDLPGAVHELIGLFAREFRDHVLIMRLHPGGNVTSLRSDHFAEEIAQSVLPPNVRLIRETMYNTYELMEIADIGITFSSQAGLEFLSLHKPLLTLGRAYYAGKGFTFDIAAPKGLGPVLHRVIAEGQLTIEQRNMIDVFLFGLIFEYLVPFNRDTGFFTEKGYRMVANMLNGRNRGYQL